MGLTWLEDKSWSEITRDERFFCAHLYKTVLHDKNGVTGFVGIINDNCNLDLPVDANWELGYEVCFYRDFHFFNRGKDNYKFECKSPKRTFDLCLFSDKHVVIIEAKAYQNFDSNQICDFNNDKKFMQDLQLPVETILVPLVSSYYSDLFNESGFKKCECFKGREPLTWECLSEKYENDQILKHADEVFIQRHNHMTGKSLVELFHSETTNPSPFWIGRSPKNLALDALNCKWNKHLYKIDSTSISRPNHNWHSLEEFVGKMI